jgi:short-subunit dehydrogenase
VLVTGASGGIGAATAHRLASAGARLALHGRDRPVLEDLAHETGGIVMVADLTAPGAASQLVADTEERLGPLDIVVSSAGVGWAGDFVTMDPGTVDCLLTLNLSAHVHLARAVLPGMVKRGRGHLVLVGSIAGHVGVRQEAVYSAAKSGLAGLATALRHELAPTGVEISLVSPAVVATAFFDRRGRPYDRSRPRPIPAERVAAAVEAAVRRRRPRLIVPPWMGFPVAVAAVAPGLYHRLAARWG